jgi:hypothetical protein
VEQASRRGFAERSLGWRSGDDRGAWPCPHCCARCSNADARVISASRSSDGPFRSGSPAGEGPQSTNPYAQNHYWVDQYAEAAEPAGVETTTGFASRRWSPRGGDRLTTKRRESGGRLDGYRG